MIDWNLVVKVVGGGFGATILVLVILSLVAWIMGLLIKKIQAKSKDSPAKEE